MTLQWGHTSPVSDPSAVFIGKVFGNQVRGDWKSRRTVVVWLTCTVRTGRDLEPGEHLKVNGKLGRNRKIRGMTGGCTLTEGFPSQWRWQVVLHGDHVPAPLYMLLPGTRALLPPHALTVAAPRLNSFPDLPRGGHHLPAAPSRLALPPHSTFRAELKVTVHLPLPCPASPNHETATF